MENPSGVIRYLIKRDGPQPEGKLTSPIDYGHYIEKQVRPIVKTIAQVYDLGSGGGYFGSAEPVRKRLKRCALRSRSRRSGRSNRSREIESNLRKVA